MSARVSSYPSNLAALAKRCVETGLELPWLRSVQAFGETVDLDVRKWCQRAWGVPVLDKYSAVEVGMIALQCPGGEHLHCLSETVRVEVIDQHGAPCLPGAIGRIVVTPLHAYATPLLRYAIGDYAEVGEPCPCGRNLPVLKRILGRTRNMLVRPQGGRFWPTFTHLSAIGAISQFQIVQSSPSDIEARIVARPGRDLLPEEEIRAALASDLDVEYRVEIKHCLEIPRHVGGKYEEVISQIEDER